MSTLHRTRAFLAATFPNGVALYQRVRASWRRMRWGEQYTQNVFSRIYRNNVWANPESPSGTCATHGRTEDVRRALPGLVRSLSVRSFLDAPCGDFNWMKLVDLGVDHYIGGDIVPDLIARNQAAYGDAKREFRVLDITSDPIPTVDMILCRDCLVHLSHAQCLAAIGNFKRSGSTYLLTTSYRATTRNVDIPTGEAFMVNLELPPFGFPPPLQFIPEEPPVGRGLGLWRIDAL